MDTEKPSDSPLARYARHAARRLERATQELNANLDRTDLKLQQAFKAWHGACQQWLMAPEKQGDGVQAVRIHGVLAMSAQTYLYWQRMASKGWQAIPEEKGGFPPHHLTAKTLAGRVNQAILLAGQCLQDIMLNWFRIGSIEQDNLLRLLSRSFQDFATFRETTGEPATVWQGKLMEMLERLADDLDRLSSRMRRQTEGWVNFGPGQRLPGIGIPHDIRTLLEELAAFREEALANAADDREIGRLYGAFEQILPGLHEVAGNLRVMTDDIDATELECWVHFLTSGFVRLSEISRSHAAVAAILFADALNERLELERKINPGWLGLTDREKEAARPPSMEKAGAMMGQVILQIGQICHHRRSGIQKNGKSPE